MERDEHHAAARLWAARMTSSLRGSVSQSPPARRSRRARDQPASRRSYGRAGGRLLRLPPGRRQRRAEILHYLFAPLRPQQEIDFGHCYAEAFQHPGRQDTNDRQSEPPKARTVENGGWVTRDACCVGCGRACPPSSPLPPLGLGLWPLDVWHSPTHHAGSRNTENSMLAPMPTAQTLPRLAMPGLLEQPSEPNPAMAVPRTAAGPVLWSAGPGRDPRRGGARPIE